MYYPAITFSIAATGMLPKLKVGEYGADNCPWEGKHSSLQCLCWNNGL